MGFKLPIISLILICPSLGLFLPSDSDTQLDESAQSQLPSTQQNEYSNDFLPGDPDTGLNNQYVDLSNQFLDTGSNSQIDNSIIADTIADSNQNNPVQNPNFGGQIGYLSSNSQSGDPNSNNQNGDINPISPGGDPDTNSENGDFSISSLPDTRPTDSENSESAPILQPETLDTDDPFGGQDTDDSVQNQDVNLLRIQDGQGAREVAYFTTPDGYAVINGDVIYGPVENLLAREIGDDSEIGIDARAFSIPKGAWPKGVITYKFDSDVGEQAMGGIVKTAISRWMNVAPYLTFTQVKPNSPTFSTTILTISTLPCSGSNAVVRGWGQKDQVMHLQRSCKNGASTVDASHEFGHVLGIAAPHPPK